MLIISLWMTGAIVSWLGVALWTKTLRKISWKEFFRLAMQTRESSWREVVKWVMFIVAWPIEVIAVVYQSWYMKHMTNTLLKSFSKLEES